VSHTILAPEYTKQVFVHKSLKALVKKVLPKVRSLKRSLKFNALAVRGHSGIIVGTVLSYQTGIPLLVVRKPGESRHDSLHVNGNIPNECRYLIVDDLISTGSTIRFISNKLKEATTFKGLKTPTLVGILLYYESYNRASFQCDSDSELVPVYNMKGAG